MGEVSAIPSELEGWSGWTSGLHQSLTRMAREVNDAVIAFNGAKQEPPFTGQIPTIGDDLAAHAARNQAVDQWVGRVGHAFENLDHLHVPPQLYKANMEDFGHGLVKVPESMVTRQVGGDPFREAEDAANGTKLAFQMRDAEARGDTSQVQALLAQLANQSAAFSFAFFQNLGPDGTTQALYAMWLVRDPDQASGGDQYQSLLRAFDSALGQATNNPDWDPAFTSALLDRHWQGPWTDAATSTMIPHVQLSLLQYGTYSEDFLTGAADLFLFPNLDQRSTYPLDAVPTVLDALARNPDAAYDYLTASHSYLGEEMPRLALLLEQRSWTDDESAALARMISAAGSSSTGTWSNDQQLLQVIIQLDASIPTTLRYLPDVGRGAIADIVAKHIVDVSKDPHALEFFKDLSKGNDDIGVTLAKAAIAQYTGSMPTFPPGMPLAVRQEKLVNWAHTQGNALAIVLQALEENGLEEAENKTKAWEWRWTLEEVGFNGVLLVVTPEVKVGSEIAKWAIEAGVEGGKAGLFRVLEQQAKPDFVGQAMAKYSANAKAIMSEQVKETTYLLYLRGDIPSTPPGEDPLTYLKHLTEGYASTYKNEGTGYEGYPTFSAYLHAQGYTTEQVNLLQGTLDAEISHDESILGGG